MSLKERMHKLESGQALMEYWPTIPAAIAIVISASIMVSFLKDGFSQTADVLHRSSAGIEMETCEVTDTEVSGPTQANPENHSITLVANDYDPETGTTTVTYQVTSGGKPDISHWILGIPKAVADNILESSEAYEWTDSDPTTGAKGIKFDTGYNSDGGEGGKGKRTIVGRTIPHLYLLQDETTSGGSFVNSSSREISLVLQGQYEFDSVYATTKSGANDGDAQISAPVTIIIDDGHTETTIKAKCD